MERFYGKGRHTLQPATAHNDVQNKFEKLSETLLDLQEEQRNNAAAIRCVMQRVETIAKDVDDLKKQLSQRTQATSQSQACKRIPSALSMAIKSIYWGLPQEQQYKVEESYRSEHNQRVSAWLLDRIGKARKLQQYREYYSKAVYRYYESRRRKFKDLAECRADAVKMNGKKSKKKRLQKTLYERRKSVLEDDEKVKWDQIDPSYMTSESDAELDQKKIKELHTPSWRSAGLNRLINKLDRRLAAKETQKEFVGFKRKERIAGPPSKSEVPIGAPEWAVSMCSTAAYPNQTSEQVHSTEQPQSPIDSNSSTVSPSGSLQTSQSSYHKCKDKSLGFTSATEAPTCSTGGPKQLYVENDVSFGLHTKYYECSSDDDFSSDSF
ncbi:hypothetical protein EMCRGX_G011159 [Ephydatia muelleri]